MDYKKYAKYYKNKYRVTAFVFLIYILFLDDVDIFTIINQNQKLHRLEASCQAISENLDSTRALYQELRSNAALESFAREKKFFKLKNEDIFVITYD